jgi:putative transposase
LPILTYKFRLKDGRSKETLKTLAGNVNFVWNFSNEVIRRKWKESRQYTSKSILNPLIKGSSDFLNINSQTVQAVAYECLLRTQKVKKHVRFRTGRKNLGWIPFNGQTFKFHGGYCAYNGFKFRLWQHRKLPPSAVIKTGSFVEDSRGRWYLCLQCEVSDADYYLPEAKGEPVGVDPGQKTQMTLSDGKKYERANITKTHEEKLGNAQKFGKKKQVKKINAKIKNKRLDSSHKASHDLASNYKIIFFGDINSSGLAKTRQAKGIYDAGIYQLKTFLDYKAKRHQGWFQLVNEQNSTVTCSHCLQKTGPSGLSGLGIREWTCCFCETSHDRDVNAAKNILRFGHETLIDSEQKRSD